MNYITGVLVSSERSDQLTLIPLLESMENHLVKSYEDVTADAGYESEENYTYFEGKPATVCYIKPQNYKRSKTKKYKSNMALRENMSYDEELDEYTCQAGKKLRAVYVGNKKARLVVRARSPVTSARAAKAVRTKRNAPVRRTNGQCRYQKSSLSSASSHWRVSRAKRAFCYG